MSATKKQKAHIQLTLNGEPTEFILTVTVKFNVSFETGK